MDNQNPANLYCTLHCTQRGFLLRNYKSDDIFPQKRISNAAMITFFSPIPCLTSPLCTVRAYTWTNSLPRVSSTKCQKKDSFLLPLTSNSRGGGVEESTRRKKIDVCEGGRGDLYQIGEGKVREKEKAEKAKSRFRE